MKISVIFLMLFFSCATPPPVKDLLPPDAIETYLELARAVQKGETTIDFAQLRLFSSALPSYDPFQDKPGALKELTLLEGNAALNKIDELFIDYCASIPFHKIAGKKYELAGDGKQAAFHGTIEELLILSITANHQGRSIKDAYAVITMAETDVVMEKLGLAVISFAHEEREGRHFQVFTVKDGSGGTETVFFNVDVIYHWLEQQLRPR